MSTKRFAARLAVLGTVVPATGLLGAGLAAAHVTADVYGEPPAKGGYGAITLRVPNEEPAAGTVEVRVSIPAEYGITSARTKPVPGWDASITESGDVVTGITFSAGEGHEIPAGTTSYQEFQFTLGTLPENVDTLVLPAAQHYVGGEVVRWDQPPAKDGTERERPAPVVTLADPGGHGHDATADEAGTDAHAAGAVVGTSEASDDTARWLGGTGIALGALGLGAGVAATARLRKVTK